ncbi:regulator of volume decrease after cellular swelling-domain-containing protein [Fomitopsis serialis]|uniref:regulator of volume decrease after cellular swelling-domain-containing protein n=1 Tax=Fomitopsis serialis TaxID=139415 RepID=UPI0020087673|nr:regulator of volume decrease after cellular swelling-domain-containing protein [Neoantrodia serialis]KAH9921312.1 regulator of volume decrease after cellular swelling-domain-containing protein [Neoantrodia serialis]
MAPFTLVTALPNHISPEEHKIIVASTPASFASIPPVLRHKEENVSVTIDPPLEGFPLEDLANGTLYVIESALVFLSANGRGWSVEYPSITLHAISRAESGPSIYCQLDEAAALADSEAPIDEDADTEMKELIIVPRDATSLEPIFEALSLCASLHPDPASANDMDEDGDDAFIDAGAFETFNGDENEELSEVGRAALEHLESIIYDPWEKKREPEGGAQGEGAEKGADEGEDEQNAGGASGGSEPTAENAP